MTDAKSITIKTFLTLPMNCNSSLSSYLVDTKSVAISVAISIVNNPTSEDPSKSKKVSSAVLSGFIVLFFNLFLFWVER